MQGSLEPGPPDRSMPLERPRVVIAGGGVAAMEAVLALRAHLGAAVDIELISPQDQFVYRPLSVLEPFGLGAPRSFDLQPFCHEHAARYRRQALAEVWPDSQRVLTDDGEEIPYDALLLAIGAIQVTALPGALTFRGSRDAAAFSDLLDELAEGSVRRLVFVVPADVHWGLPAYELALLTAAWLSQRGVTEVRLSVVTHETRPLGVFGKAASGRVTELLDRAGIELLAERLASAVDEGGLAIAGDGLLAADRVVALPRLEVFEIPGLPQGHLGYVDTDPRMRVDGLDNVWAAGDLTWCPIKQGGLAAQQADTAAAGIAASLGAEVEVPPFVPVIRAALLTGSLPEFLRGGEGADQRLASHDNTPLWWPPSKIAGSHLAPYLARRWDGEPGSGLEDVESLYGDDYERAAENHREALELSLAAADADARSHDYGQALKWLDVAEHLNVALPAEYAEKRRDWQRSSPKE